MTTERITALALPDEGQFRRDIAAINRFQQVVHATMVSGLDYGIIPGTQKPTLLKPGAEKIAKLLGLSDQYEILDKAEDWQVPFFRYLIKCRLVHVATEAVISEGLGECNSMESKYRYRWVGERDLPVGADKSKLVSQERKAKTGGHWTVYRIDNDDIYSQVNTILKMAKKRALVDASLSAGRLSDVFTQDIEDMAEIVESKAKIVSLPKAKPVAAKPTVVKVEEETPEPGGARTGYIDLVWLKESLQRIQSKKVKGWDTESLLRYLRSFGIEGEKVSELVSQLTKEQAEQFAGMVQETLEHPMTCKA